MNIEFNESEVEDALARVLHDAYNSPRSTQEVARDEQILRQALFGKRQDSTGDTNYAKPI